MPASMANWRIFIVLTESCSKLRSKMKFSHEEPLAPAMTKKSLGSAPGRMEPVHRPITGDGTVRIHQQPHPVEGLRDAESVVGHLDHVVQNGRSHVRGDKGMHEFA